MTMKPQPEGMHREARQGSRKPNPDKPGKLLPADEYDIFDGKDHAGITQRAKGGWRGLPDGLPLPDGNLPPVHPTHGHAMAYIREQRAKLAAQPSPVVPPPVAPEAANIDTGGGVSETEHVTIVPDPPQPSPEAPPVEPAPAEPPSEAPPEGLIPEVVEPLPETGPAGPYPDAPPQSRDLPDWPGDSPNGPKPDEEFHDPFADQRSEEPDLSKEFPFA